MDGLEHGEMTADVVVVGAGFAGLAAAIEARGRGKEVVVFSKTGPFANNSSMGGGLFLCVDTPMQRDMGVQDSAQLLADDILKANHHSVDPQLVKCASDGATELYDWLVSFGARFVNVVRFPGQSLPRLHREEALSGAGVEKKLLEAARRQGITVHLGTPATQLMRDETGKITGITVKDKGNGEVRVFARRGVILAAGGFARSSEMVREYAPNVANIPRYGSSGSTGDGIRMGLSAGGEAMNMDAMVAGPSFHVRYRMNIDWDMVDEGAIFVNVNGRRFVDERVGYNFATLPVTRQPEGKAFVVFDEETNSRVARMKRYDKPGFIIEADTAEDLALKLGIPGRAFRQTIDEYNAALPSGPDVYGHQVSRHALKGRLFAVPVTAGIVFTHGGLRINTHAQVLDNERQPIPRLYAAGDNAAGLGGPATAEALCPGYLSGLGFMSALVFGRIAGRNAAEEPVRVEGNESSLRQTWPNGLQAHGRQDCAS